MYMVTILVPIFSSPTLHSQTGYTPMYHSRQGCSHRTVQSVCWQSFSHGDRKHKLFWYSTIDNLNTTVRDIMLTAPHYINVNFWLCKRYIYEAVNSELINSAGQPHSMAVPIGIDCCIILFIGPWTWMNAQLYQNWICKLQCLASFYRDLATTCQLKCIVVNEDLLKLFNYMI